MSNIIISTCGTSILTSGENRDIVGLIIKNANEKEVSDKRILSHIEECRKKIHHMDFAYAQKKSAELNAIIKYYKGKLKNINDIHILITSDTFLGKATGDIVKEWLEKNSNFTVIVHNQRDLATKKLEEFHLALTELAKFLTDIIPQYKNINSKIIFNLTGGFKSVQGFMQVFAMIYGDETIYVFESSEELLRIPKIPIKIDLGIVKEFEKTLRRLVLNLKVPKEEIEKLPETLFDKIDNEYSISAWGIILWEKAKSEENFYSKELLMPPSEKIKFSDRFKEDINSLSPDRIKIVNERIDDLALYLEKGINPNRLNFHSLQGNPIPPCTHEFYAWSDRGAKRVYGYYDNNKFICYEFEKHL